MAFLFSGPAADQSQPKARRTARVQQAPQTHPTPARSSAPQVSAAPTRLIPLTDWNLHHAWPPIGGLRHLVFFEKTNGFHQVVRRVGRRVLIDEAAFFAWVDSKGGHHASV
ncbi:hypothetical protein LJR038_003075 [Acidovorax sp. LjRoot38]|uniref:hypothetical protein n=1 Tax=Acidovorax sp. LjRoot38 TaxID=3342327 RepID=UPI003ECFB0B5